MAYILGFWFADGYIDDECFGISQHKKDEYILHQILHAMKANYPLKKSKKNNRVILIYSRRIIEDIKKLGGKERKSLDVEFPDIPMEYLGPFIRGYFDGDGCITITKVNNNLSTEFTTGSKHFAYGLLEVIEKNTDIVGTVYIKIKKAGTKLFNGIRKKTQTYYSIRFSNNESIKLRNFIYQYGNLKLLRKQEKFNSVKDIRILKRDFMPFEEAREFTRNLGIGSKTEWEQYIKTDQRPINLPTTPARSYKSKGWISWKDWLGYTTEKVKGEKPCWAA